MQTRESQFVPFQYQPFGYNPFQFFQPPSQRTSQVSNASNISQPQMQMQIHYMPVPMYMPHPSQFSSLPSQQFSQLPMFGPPMQFLPNMQP